MALRGQAYPFLFYQMTDHLLWPHDQTVPLKILTYGGFFQVESPATFLPPITAVAKISL